jgi:hypothetical protein
MINTFFFYEIFKTSLEFRAIIIVKAFQCSVIRKLLFKY